MSRYILDEVANVNSTVTDEVKLLTIKPKAVEVAPAVPVEVVHLADSDFWMTSAIILGILGFLIGWAV